MHGISKIQHLGIGSFKIFSAGRQALKQFDGRSKGCTIALSNGVHLSADRIVIVGFGGRGADALLQHIKIICPFNQGFYTCERLQCGKKYRTDAGQCQHPAMHRVQLSLGLFCFLAQLFCFLRRFPNSGSSLATSLTQLANCLPGISTGLSHRRQVFDYQLAALGGQLECKY